MTAIVRWHGDRLSQQLQNAAARGVKSAALLLLNRARLLCNRPAKRIRQKRLRTTKAGKKGSQYTLFVPSAPGSPPAVRTSFGRRNIDMVFLPQKLLARVGVRKTAEYMIFLELGTKHIARRPWLSSAGEQTRGQINTILQTALKQGTGGK